MKYKINKVIVRNLYSEVMTGEYFNDLQSHRVIIKTVVPPIFGTTLKRMSKAMMLEHFGIPKLVDFGECCEKGIKKYYITNMHIGGITLTQLLNRLSVLKLKMPGSVVFYIISSISDILEYTHRFPTESSGFMFHGNICPDQILISFDGSVFLTDTGIADLLTYRYDGIGLVKNEFSVFNHPDIHRGKVCRKHHEFYSLGILLLCMLKGKDDFFLFMNKLDTGKRGPLADVLLSLEPQICRIVAGLTGEKLPGVNGIFSSIEEVKFCLNKHIKENGIENGKSQLLLLVYALFGDILEFPGSIHDKVQKLVYEQCFDSAIIYILQKTMLNTKTQDNFSAFIQDYKTESISIPVSSLSQCMQESTSNP
jgi:serine/threonine protein kinase